MLILGLYWCIQAYIDWRSNPVLTTIASPGYPLIKVRFGMIGILKIYFKVDILLFSLVV
jgi:hypothetical protein